MWLCGRDSAELQRAGCPLTVTSFLRCDLNLGYTCRHLHPVHEVFSSLSCPPVMTWTSGELDTMSWPHGNMRLVTPICVGCKLDGLGFSYMGLVSCTFLAVSCPLFQGWIWSTSMTTRLRQKHMSVVVVDYQTSILHVFCNYLY